MSGILSSPFTLGHLTLKNRFVLAAMGSNFAETDGSCTEKIQAYYEARAAGGCGLLILETTSVAWPAGCSMPNMVGFSEDRFIPGLSELTRRVHAHGAKIAAQLNHSGKVAQEDTVAGRPMWVASKPKRGRTNMMDLLTREEMGNFIKMAGPDGKGPQYHPINKDEIATLVEQFANAAKRAQQAGFDAIEIHAGHGYLIANFLSPATNHRDDEYGGSLENRARLLVEIIHATRAACEDQLPVLVRLDAMEYRIDGGIRPEDFVAVAKLAEAAGAAAIDVSAYGNNLQAIAFTEGPLVHQPDGYIPFAIAAKKALDIPVIAVGRIELDSAEKHVKQGDFDLLALGRKLLADPELPNKYAEGDKASIRPCIYCYICVSQIFVNKPLCCAVNPAVGNEHQPAIIATDKKHMVVVGGGPGGMESACALAEAGHKVTLIEQSSQLGGTARIAALAYEPNGRLIDYHRHKMLQLGVSVKLNTKATPEQLSELKPDHVIVAVGANRQAPDIQGKAANFVFDGEEMRGLLLGGDTRGMAKLPLWKRVFVSTAQTLGLTNHIGLVRELSKLWMPLGKRVVIIGGGLVGVEIAELLIERGRHVTLLEPSRDLGPELSIVRRMRVVHLLKEHGCELHTQVTIDKLVNGKVFYHHNGQAIQLATDHVIIAQGAQTNTSLAEQLESAGFKVTSVGDCREIGYIDGAVHNARQAVNALLA
jgi:2,4-dienoyl-CoA reductase-like NADH-dependent reductase (Old Yellow Enzyme family)/thioredoxin reductase